MKHLDLFSGIGGFAYAAQQVWGKEYENIAFCDNNKFCQQVIKKHWPDATICGDIKDFTKKWLIANTYKSRRIYNKSQEQPAKSHNKTQREFISNFQSPFLLTGGFPCQPFSQAGQRRGTEDDRHLWPEMFRVINEFQPRWIIAENVRGLLTIEGGLVFEQVCADLEASDYEVQPLIIPACAINAPHRRDRVWIVAHKSSEGLERQRRARARLAREDSNASNTADNGFNRNDAPSILARKIAENNEQSRGRWSSGSEGCDWKRNWFEIATELCGVDDGLPAELDRFKLSKAGHRIERLKALGNAIVPQVAIEIMNAIKYAKKKPMLYATQKKLSEVLPDG